MTDEDYEYEEEDDGKVVRMTQAQFVSVMFQTLQRMGDPVSSDDLENDPEWVREYNMMKHFTVKQFADLCNVGNHLYNRSKNKNNN